LARKATAQAQLDAIGATARAAYRGGGQAHPDALALQARVNAFRTQKETLKAQYTAAQAVTTVNERRLGDLQVRERLGRDLAARAQDKIANMQARSSAMTSCSSQACLEDVGGGTDDIQKELDQVGNSAQVDQELAALKAEVGGGRPGRRAAGEKASTPPLRSLPVL